MSWPNLLWLALGLDCICGVTNGYGEDVAYMTMDNVPVLLLLVITLVGTITCVRLLWCLLVFILRPLLLTREERMLRKFSRQARKATSDYLGL